MKRPLNDFSTEPIYTLNTVTQRTGVSANMLRAWEARYQLVKPEYRRGGQPLYSERDIALLGWIRRHLLAGLTIRRVAALLAEARSKNEILWVETPQPVEQQSHQPQTADTLTNLITPLTTALTTLNIPHSRQLLNQALVNHSISAVCTGLILPVRQHIMRTAAQGALHPAYLRLIDGYLRSALASRLWDQPGPPRPLHAYIGCAPGDNDEIDTLVVALMAGEVGCDVRYLGPDVPMEVLYALPETDFSILVILMASTIHGARQIVNAQQSIQAGNMQTILFGYGGRVFAGDEDLRSQTAGVYLGLEPIDWGITLDSLLTDASASDFSRFSGT